MKLSAFFAQVLESDNNKIERLQDTWRVVSVLDSKFEEYEKNYKKQNGEKPMPMIDLTEKDRLHDSLILALSENDIKKFEEYSENYALSELFEFYLLRQAFTI